MTETVPTSEVLNRAADLIEERGWTQGDWPCDEDSPLCVEGGIMTVLGLETMDFDEFWETPAYKALVAYLGLAVERRGLMKGCGNVWSWNDHQESAEPVIETLRACAVIEASHERQTAEVSA